MITTEELMTMSKDELVQTYEAEGLEKPHHATKEKKLREGLSIALNIELLEEEEKKEEKTTKLSINSLDKKLEGEICWLKVFKPTWETSKNFNYCTPKINGRRFEIMYNKWVKVPRPIISLFENAIEHTYARGSAATDEDRIEANRYPFTTRPYKEGDREPV